MDAQDIGVRSGSGGVSDVEAFYGAGSYGSCVLWSLWGNAADYGGADCEGVCNALFEEGYAAGCFIIIQKKVGKRQNGEKNRETYPDIVFDTCSYIYIRSRSALCDGGRDRNGTGR